MSVSTTCMIRHIQQKRCQRAAWLSRIPWISRLLRGEVRVGAKSECLHGHTGILAAPLDRVSAHNLGDVGIELVRIGHNRVAVRAFSAAKEAIHVDCRYQRQTSDEIAAEGGGETPVRSRTINEYLRTKLRGRYAPILALQNQAGAERVNEADAIVAGRIRFGCCQRRTTARGVRVIFDVAEPEPQRGFAPDRLIHAELI